MEEQAYDAIMLKPEAFVFFSRQSQIYPRILWDQGATVTLLLNCDTQRPLLHH